MEAYPVPFRVDRSRSPRLRLVNTGDERLRGVTVTLRGPGLLAISPIRTVEPQGSLSVRVRGDRLERDSSLIVRWLRPDDSEYLWRVVF